MHMVVSKVIISKQERSGKLCSSLQPKWRAQTILHDAIKLGGARLATKSNEFAQPEGLKPSQAILPDAIKPGGPRNHYFASGTKWLAQAILPDAIKTGVSTACDEKSSSSYYNEVNTILNTLIGITSHLARCHLTGGDMVHQNECTYTNRLLHLLDDLVEFSAACRSAGGVMNQPTVPV
ncbi:hypothetical protein DFH08DRAFT_798907 [Mycena albidolilacea]|uniref:Uncharacterized protein n=1 Tax=Mycena albidolilacea TaxID=1033008 RepID=A0AAD7APJ7_9AGAR|nr:hypothetical protein DFH08DRAFT_798907 [Mycena albidolilacea]